MTNVLSLVSYPVLPARVGGQKGIALFNKYFSKQVNLVCVATHRNDPAAAEGYEVLNILSNAPVRYINPFYFFTLRKIIRQRKITHLLLEHPYYGWLGILLKKRTGIKLIVHSHNIEGLRWKGLNKWWWKILWYYESWVHRCADYSFFIHDDDRRYALAHFGLDQTRCITVTYGIEWNTAPAEEERALAKAELRRLHVIPADHHILLFNGAFQYSPNRNGLKNILHDINPALLQSPGFKYTIIICGKDIPAELAAEETPGVVFAGFVDDISLYFKGADIFLNALTEGAGIKTKLVEALGHGMNAVSTQNGAIGVDPAICSGKLMVVPDGDWSSFAAAVMEAARTTRPTPATFFEHFYWGDITVRAARFITTG